MTTINEELTQMAELVGGRAWGLDKGKPRIYMPSRRDTKTFFEFPDAAYSDGNDEVNGATTLGGAALKVYIDDCGQSAKWYASQKRIVLDGLRQAALALMAWSEGGDAQAIMELEVDADVFQDDNRYDAVAHALVKGRIDDARDLIGLDA